MPGMSHLVDKCAIQRRSTTSQGYGSAPSYAAAHLSSVPCRYMEKQQRGFNSITAQWTVETVSKILFRSGTDVIEGDRISNITLPDGTVITENYEVDGGSLQHRGRMTRHRMVTLKRIS